MRSLEPPISGFDDRPPEDDELHDLTEPLDGASRGLRPFGGRSSSVRSLRSW